MTLLGADPDGLDQLAALIGRTTTRIDQTQREIGRHLESAAWRGADADLTRSEWRRRGAPAVQGVRAALVACATDLRSQAVAQRHASSAEAGLVGGGGAGGGAGSWGGVGEGTAPPPSGEDFSKRWDRPREEIWTKEGERVRDADSSGPRQEGDEDRPGETLLDDLEINARWEGFDTSFGKGDADWSLEKAPWGAFAGVVASGGAGVALNRDGLRADASAGAGAVAEVQGGTRGEYGELQGRAAVEAAADADSGITVDGKGVAAKVGAHALAGATVGGSWSSPELAGAQGGVEGSLSYGVGLDAQADMKFTADRVKMKFKLGATYGIGASGGVSIDIKPKEVFESIETGLDKVNGLFD